MLWFTKALDLDPPKELTVILLSNLAECYLCLKHWEKAAEHATSALKLNPQHTKSLNRLNRAKEEMMNEGLKLLVEGNFEAAQVKYEVLQKS